MTIGEVRGKAIEVIARRAQVVIDHIEDDGEPFAVGGRQVARWKAVSSAGVKVSMCSS